MNALKSGNYEMLDFLYKREFFTVNDKLILYVIKHRHTDSLLWFKDHCKIHKIIKNYQSKFNYKTQKYIQRCIFNESNTESSEGTESAITESDSNNVEQNIIIRKINDGYRCVIS